jgi:hypothetical protein
MFNRLKLASLASNPVVTEELPGDAAGRDGEETFVSALEKTTSSKIFREVRVPQQRDSLGDTSSSRKRGGVGGGRFEMDVILASRSCLIVVEVKNWSGAIAPANDDDGKGGGGDWVQTRRDGSALVHADPPALLKRKAEALAAWLAAAHNLHLPAGFLRTKLVLVNGRNLKVHPRLTAVGLYKLNSVYP